MRQSQVRPGRTSIRLSDKASRVRLSHSESADTINTSKYDPGDSVVVQEQLELLPLAPLARDAGTTSPFARLSHRRLAWSPYLLW